MRLNNSSDDVKSWDEGYRHRMNSLHTVTGCGVEMIWESYS